MNTTMSHPVRSIALTHNEVEYLVLKGFLPPGLLESLQRDERWQTDDIVALSVPPATADQFCEGFSAELTAVGYDEQSALTAEGQLLKALIGRFYGEIRRGD